MNNIITIFSSRIKKEKEKRAIYNKYIFNSHLIMFLIITFGAILFNYSSWLSKAGKLELKSVLLVILLIMSYILATIKAKTFIKEADSIFLLPLENKYKEIMAKIYIPAIITKLFLALAFIFISYPIIKKINLLTNYNKYIFISFLFSLLISIILTTIQTHKLVIYSNIDIKYLATIFLIYLLSSILFIFGIINFAFVLTIIIFVIYNKKISNNINWYGASDYDSARVEKYLKLVNMFVDIPIETIKVKRRKYLDILLPKLNSTNFNKENVYNYYFIRAFLRQENTIFLVVRLFLFAILFIYNFNNLYVASLVIVSFNYLAVIQLLPVYKRLTSVIWFYIIPVKNEIKLKSFKKLINTVLIIFTLLLILIYTVITKNIFSSCLLLISLIISVLINNYFLNKLK